MGFKFHDSLKAKFVLKVKRHLFVKQMVLVKLTPISDSIKRDDVKYSVLINKIQISSTLDHPDSVNCSKLANNKKKCEKFIILLIH